MNSDIKKDFVLRISQANNVEMIIVSYDIILTYIQDAKYVADSNTEYRGNLDLAGRFVDELLANLHYEYEISKTLKSIYLYVKKCLRDAKYDKNMEALDEVVKIISGLKESYEQIKAEDTSEPLMKNTQAVMVGMTYGKNKILDELSNDCASRGYRV